MPGWGWALIGVSALVLLLAVALFLAAVKGSGLALFVSPTPTPTDTPTISASPAWTLSPTSTGTPESTATLSLTPPPTATWTPDWVGLTVEVNTNCRTGPEQVFPSVGSIRVGEVVEVVGRSPNGDFWIVNNPDMPGTCWVWAQYAAVSGNVEALPVIQPPRTPTPSLP
jgi:hypothetical protein